MGKNLGNVLQRGKKNVLLFLLVFLYELILY